MLRAAKRLHLAIALALFVAAGAVAIWQNLRVGVLWDLSYILNTATRITVGDLPYSDFPLSHPPLTFLIQAGIIELFNSSFAHHVFYSALLSGLAAVLGFTVLQLLLAPRVANDELILFFLSLPLAVLGIYAVYPHPFYDPDACFFILLGLCALLATRARNYPPLLSVVTGLLLAIPVFVKQNMGLAFLFLVHLALLFTSLPKSAGRARACHLRIAAGSLVGLIIAAILIEMSVGVGNYLRWTLGFAQSRRLGSLEALATGFGIYRSPLLWTWAAAAGAGLLFLKQAGTSKVRLAMGTLALTLPFVWAIFSDLILLWPLLFLLSCSLSLRRIADEGASFEALLPFIIAAVAHASFWSQTAYGSSYGIWPLAVVALATVVVNLRVVLRQHLNEIRLAFAIGAASCLAVAGFSYVWSNERLAYARVHEGPLARAEHPTLKGLSIRGHFISELEKMLAFVEEKIPRDEEILTLPGEDPIHFALRRVPDFPVLLFDPTINPYSPREIRSLARSTGTEWLVVKMRLQLVRPPMPELPATLALLKQDFRLITRLGSYSIYRRGGRRTSAVIRSEQGRPSLPKA